MADLKPCPFCGAQPDDEENLIDQNEGIAYVSRWVVGCPDCPAFMDGFDSPEEAAKAWNTRASAPAATETT